MAWLCEGCCSAFHVTNLQSSRRSQSGKAVVDWKGESQSMAVLGYGTQRALQ